MARQRDNAKALAKFTLSELESEIARRKNATSEWGYVVIPPEEDDDDLRPRVGIVLASYWKKEKCLDDRCLGHDVTLPKGFYEASESQYIYTKGDLAAAKQALDNAGFKYFGEWE